MAMEFSVFLSSPRGDLCSLLSFPNSPTFLNHGSAHHFRSRSHLKEGLAPINLIVENEFHRAIPGGTGGVKTIGNYAADKVISTPAIKGTILPGITRKSIIEVAQSQGFQVEEKLVAIDELLEADEVFCTETAVVVSPVGSITYLGKRVEYGNSGVGAVSQQLYSALTSLQMGLSEDKLGWTVVVD